MRISDWSSDVCSSDLVGQPVVVQGGMSGWVRATETRSGEIALSLARMSVIEAIDPVNRTATVQEGVVIETLETERARHGLTFPIVLCGQGGVLVGRKGQTHAGGSAQMPQGIDRRTEA